MVTFPCNPGESPDSGRATLWGFRLIHLLLNVPRPCQHSSEEQNVPKPQGTLSFPWYTYLSSVPCFLSSPLILKNLTLLRNALNCFSTGMAWNIHYNGSVAHSYISHFFQGVGSPNYILWNSTQVYVGLLEEYSLYLVCSRLLVSHA